MAEMKKVILIDSDADERRYLDLTDDQHRLLHWLYQNDWLHPDASYEDFDKLPEFKTI